MLELVFDEIQSKLSDLYDRVTQLEAAPTVPSGGGGGSAPADAEYLVNAANATLTNEIVVTAVQGRIIYADNTPTWTTLNIGTRFQILSVNAGSTAPEWASFNWTNYSIGLGANMVHDHSTNAEGGEIPLASLGSWTQGDLIVGGGADWTDLAIGANNTILFSDGSDPSWQTLASAGIAPNDAEYLVLTLTADLTQERRLDFSANFSTTDNGANADYDVDLSNTGVGAGAYGNATNVATFTVDAQGRLTAAANVAIAGVPPLAHTILGVYHSDTTTDTVSRGSLIYGNSTPLWDELTHPGGAGYALTTDANDVLWDQTPTWTGRHTFNAGIELPTGQSIGITGNELLTIYAAGYAVFTGCNVGLVTTTPAARLHIDIADSITEGLRIENTGNEFVNFYFSGGGASANFNINYSGSGGDDIIIESDGDVQLANSGDVYIAAGDLHFITAKGIIHADGVTNGEILLANGTRYIPSGWYLSGTAGQTYTFPTASGTLVSGTGANTRVAFWTGTNTLSSDAQFTFATADNSLTIDKINLADTSNQIVFQSAGVTGTLTWTPAATNKTVTIPNYTGTVALGAGTLDTTTANSVLTTTHTHDITTTSDGDANVSTILQSDASGDLKLSNLELDDANLTFSGATTNNLITVPDNIASALEIVDAGGLEYIRIVSTNTQPQIIFDSSDPAALNTELLLGGTSHTSEDPVMVVVRSITGLSGTNAHCYVDQSTVNRTGSIGYNSFDAQPTITGTYDYNHVVGMQSRPYYDSSGTIDRLLGFTSLLDVNAGTVTSAQHYRARDLDLTGGAVTSQYAFYIVDTFSAATNNWGFYDAGDNNHVFGNLVYINETSCADVTTGMVLNQGANDDSILAVKSSDVAHGMTGVVETDTYGSILKTNATGGGMSVRGYASGITGTTFQGFSFTSDTTKTSAARAPVEVYGRFTGGTASETDAPTDANVFAIRTRHSSAFDTTFLIDEDGDTYLIRGDLHLSSGLGVIHADSVVDGDFLRANGTRYVPAGFYIDGTAGQTYTFPASSSTVIDGSGASPRIAYWSAASTLSSDAGLQVDATNDMIIVADDGGIGISDADEKLEFFTAGDAVFSNCQVGIGVTPTQLLHLFGSGTPLVKVENSAASSNAGIQFVNATPQIWQLSVNATDDLQMRSNTDGVNAIIVQNGISQNAITVQSDDDVILGGGGSGNTAIGSTVPNAKLDVDQSSSTGAIPVLKLDQGDISEQCITFSSDSTDRNLILYDVDMTGTIQLQWYETDDRFRWSKGAEFFDSGSFFELHVNDYSNAFMTAGININQGANTDEIFSVKSSTCSHTFTALTELDTYGNIKKIPSTGAGLRVEGYMEASGTQALQLVGFAYDEDTTDTANSVGVVVIAGNISDGGTGSTSLGNTGNILCVQNETSATAIFKGNGDLYLAGSVTENDWDEYDDIGILHGLRAYMSPIGSELRNRYAQWIDYAKPILEESHIISYSDDGKYMQSVRGLQMLTIDAIRQLYSKLEYLEQKCIGYENTLKSLRVQI